MTFVVLLLSVVPFVPMVHSVAVQGTKRHLELETRAGQALDNAAIARDVRRLWATDWFNDIQVESMDEPGGLAVVIRVVEKPRAYLRKVEIKRPGAPALEPASPIDLAGARQIAAAMRDQLVDDGYADAKVTAALVPVEYPQVDLRLDIEEGPRYRVGEVRFSGDLQLDTGLVRRALRAIVAHRWWRRPVFTEHALEQDIERLRSFYFSQGYFDARATLQNVQFAGKKVDIDIDIQPGLRYSPRADVCSCPLAAQRGAEKRGEIDFAARVEITEGGSVTSVVDNGPAYTTSRIEFRGNHHFSDATLRRALVFDEGDPFDPDRLRRSLARLNRMKVFDPLSESSVRLDRDPDQHRVDLTLNLREKPKGRWSLSGPAVPLSVAGSFQFAISSRLPAWGSGLLEASTYYATFSVMGVPALLRALPFGPQGRFTPFVGVQRPYWPGQGWRSGFLLSPQLGWQATLANYVITQLYEGGLPAITSRRDATPGLLVPVEWSSGARRSFTLLCEPRRPPFWRRLF